MTVRRALAWGLIFAFSAFPAAAAEISFHRGADGIDLIVIAGEIKAGDEQTFNGHAIKSKSSVVVLGSQGGALLPALEIGKNIQIKGFTTFVPAQTTCTSSCALIWLAGSDRALSKTARLGFHASYRNNNGRLEEVGAANAIIGRYLTLLNLPERSVIFATAASPYEISWLSGEAVKRSGITFRYFDLDQSPQTAASPPPAQVSPPPIQTYATTPEPRPEADAYHERVGWYYASTSETGSRFFVRAEDVAAGRADSRAIEVWIKTDDSKDRTASYASSKTLYVVNCVSKTYTTKTASYFHRNGKVETYPGSSRSEYIYPDSVFDATIALVCSDQLPEPSGFDELKD